MPKEVNIGPVRIQLTSPGTGTPLWQDVGGLLVPVGSTGQIGVTGRFVLIGVSGAGAFQGGVGVERFASDAEVATSPVVQPSANLNLTTGLGMKTAVGKYFFNFDPTDANNGEIHKFYRWRLGVLYSTTTAAISRGEVLFEATVRYA